MAERCQGEPNTSRKVEFEALDRYLEAIRKYPVLTRAEERFLAVRARDGDVAARQRLARHNLPLVVAMARKQCRGAGRLEDVIQEGNIGLMRAVEKFDPRVGTRFSTYASWWIRAFIGRYLRDARSAVRVKYGAAVQPDLSLDAPIGDDDGASYLERLEDQSPSPEESYASTRRDLRVRSALWKVRKRVGPLGWDIIHNRLRRDPPETLEQIARRWGVSRERVRQVEAQTRVHVRRHLERAHDIDAAQDAA